MKNELEIKLDNKAQEVIGEVAKEHGGGGATYTGGNGITITNENVINADVKVLEVENITQLTDEQCESLNIGDMISIGQYNYLVLSKTNEELTLIINYFDYKGSDYDIVYYTKDGDGPWNFDTQLFNELQSKFNVVGFDSQGGTMDLEEVRRAVYNGGAVVRTPIGEEVVLFVLGSENPYFSSSLITEENTTSYHKVSIGQPYEDDGVQVCDYTVEQITVGGGSGVEYVYLNPNATEIDLETAEKLTDDTNKYNCVIVLRTGDEASPNIFLRPDAQYLNTYTSNIIDGKYWKFQITDWQEEGIYVSIQEINIPVPSHYIKVYGKTDDTSSMYHTITIPCDDYTIETYEDLCQYLVGKGINSSDETYLPVNDGEVVVGVTVQVGYSSGEAYYNLWLQKLHIVSSGSIFINSVTVNVYNDEDFTITHLPQNE